MPFTLRQRTSQGVWRPMLAALAVGLFLGFAGPFGSYPAFPTATRYAFWLGLTAIGAAAAVAADAMLSLTSLRPGTMRVATAALASALPMTFVVAWTMSLVQPGRVYAPGQLPALFAAVAAVQGLIAYATALAAPSADESRIADGAPTLPPAADLRAAPTFPSALLGRLPPAIGSDIVAIETEDHYLRVHTAGGSTLILMRMADAVAMLDPQLGMQVHRRWWVAAAAVARVQAEGHKLSLRLTDGSIVPIGRTFAAAVRARFGGD